MSYEMKSVIVKGGAASPVVEPVSRTYQYRKVMKPMLERKRRARINRCLDELKDLMVTALQSEGENVSKLEKADILELTVRHLHKLRRQERLAANPVIDADRFRAGFTHAANEVSRCLAQTPGVDITLGTSLMTHLGHRLNDMDKIQPLSIHVGQNTNTYTPPSSPSASSTTSESPSMVGNIRVTNISSLQSNGGYAFPLTPASSRSGQSPSPLTVDCSQTVIPQQHLQQGLLKVVPATPVDGSMWRPW